MTRQSSGQNPSNSEMLYRLIKEVRHAFHDLANYADTMHADVGITAAMRAILEHVCTHGSNTVPKIAATKKVSRQHVQLLADALVEKRLAQWLENPQHKRSKLLGVTDLGKSRFEKMHERELKLLQTLGKSLNADDLATAISVLKKTRKMLT